MIKKCKQCGRVLTAGENNQFCENCRKLKRDRREEEKKLKDAKKKKKKR